MLHRRNILSDPMRACLPLSCLLWQRTMPPLRHDGLTSTQNEGATRQRSGDAGRTDAHGRVMFRGRWPPGVRLRLRALCAAQVACCVVGWCAVLGPSLGSAWCETLRAWFSLMPCRRFVLFVLCTLPGVAWLAHAIGGCIVVPGQQFVVRCALWVLQQPRVRSWAPHGARMVQAFIEAYVRASSVMDVTPDMS